MKMGQIWIKRGCLVNWVEMDKNGRKWVTVYMKGILKVDESWQNCVQWMKMGST